jgi:hypothetical protein
MIRTIQLSVLVEMAICEEANLKRPKLQVPAEAQDSESICASPLLFSASKPGTSIALPQRPFRRLTTDP